VAPSTRTLRPQDEISRYRIVGPLGAGGMGEVYLAQDTALGRNVALKILPPEIVRSEERVRRFVLEAKSASSLSHPNIVTIHEIGQDMVKSAGEAASGPVHFISMELVSGRTLSALIHEERTDLRTLLGYLAQAADGIAKAHAAGIVHRDLKPGNIMLTRAGAKLMDFGLARATGLPIAAAGLTESPTVSRPLTAEGAIVGTLQYMAPEQLEGKEADGRADLWALGCVLYEMATGRRAFGGTSQASLIAAVLKESPRPMTELQPLTPPALDRIVTQCLAKDPDDRWQSAHDLAFDLEGLASSTTGGACVEEPVARRGAPTRLRERLGWAAGGDVLAQDSY
jgi:serine/threonine protein kinase